MPAKKTARRAAQRAALNQPLRTRTRTMVSRARRSIQSGSLEAAEEAVRRAESALDHAAVKAVIHKNSAARGKGRLWARFNERWSQAASG